MTLEQTPAALGHDGRLYFLAFDHRGVFARSVLDEEESRTPEQERTIADCKRVIFDGGAHALAAGGVVRGQAGVLIDEHYGGEVARAALENGVVQKMPDDEDDSDIFELAYGADFGAHIESFDPDFAKVLVRWNADGDRDGNAVQAERLRDLSEWLRARGRRFLFELLIPPTAAQLAQAGGEQLRFELEQRPALMVRGIAELQAAGVEVDVWKLEGIDDPADAAAVVEQARSGPGREGVVCTVLGAGAGAERVERWLRVAAATEGFCGFAIGRSIWREPLRRWLAEELPREQAVQQIAREYERLVAVYEGRT
jgi:myo-inositol catabolism protein IolC